MNRADETAWITLLTAHKGVDLHAATALQVMRDRLEGGDRLRGLFRCEWHGFPEGRVDGGVDALLATGRFYNPNKHHYGVFRLAGAPAPWSAGCRELPAAWPGDPLAGDLSVDRCLYTLLLGGDAADPLTAVDVASLVRDQRGPVVSGVLWRLVLEADPAAAVELASVLAVARRRKEGLLVNLHLEDWYVGVPRAGSGTKER